MIFDVEYEQAFDGFNKAVRKLEFDLEINKVVRDYLTGKCLENRRARPQVKPENTT